MFEAIVFKFKLNKSLVGLNLIKKIIGILPNIFGAKNNWITNFLVLFLCRLCYNIYAQGYFKCINMREKIIKNQEAFP